jgi:hypothetical protein
MEVLVATIKIFLSIELIGRLSIPLMNDECMLRSTGFSEENEKIESILSNKNKIELLIPSHILNIFNIDSSEAPLKFVFEKLV